MALGCIIVTTARSSNCSSHRARPWRRATSAAGSPTA